MDVPSCPGCQRFQRRVAELEAEVAHLKQLVEESHRSQKRQAAPFAKQPAKSKPRKPGRKSGNNYGAKAHREPPKPEQIDEVLEASLPKACPDCGGSINETDVQPQYQVEIPRRPIHRQFNVHIGQCRSCQKRVQGRHPLQTSDALGAAASQLGPDLQASIVALNKNGGLSMGKVATGLHTLFGIQLSRGGVAQVLLRAARRCQPFYQFLRTNQARSAWVVPDETGWRVGGRLAWLHGFVSPQETVYVIDPKRGGKVAEELLGSDYTGVMIHDGWSPYDNFFHADHQQCLAHLLRRCHEMLQTATRGAARFPRQVMAWLQKALALRDRHANRHVSDHGLATARSRLLNHLVAGLRTVKSNPANERLAKHLWKHRDQLLTFLWLPGIDATNWRGEHAMRFGVILRKVWGGNRTWRGAEAQAVLMSTWRTCQQHNIKPMDFISQLLRKTPALLALPP